MASRCAALLAVLLLCCKPALAAMDCPAPPSNVAKDLVVDTGVGAQGLKSLVSGTLKNHTETTVKNLWEKYPNADKLTVATLMMSVYCQQIDKSTTLTDQEKLDRLMVVNQSIITLMK
jgi:hypothetical protein